MVDTRYFLIVIQGDVEPGIMGPFSSAEDRDEAALDWRKQDPNEKDGLYKLDLKADKFESNPSKILKLSIDSFSDGFFDKCLD